MVESEKLTEKEYYSKELEILSKAYFDTSQKTTNFFQFSLVLFSAPFALLGLQSFNTIRVGSIFTLVGIVGFFILAYLADLRFESLQYARAVNHIRSIFFTQQSEHELSSKQHYFCNNTVLIGQRAKPNYYDTNQFIYIVAALSTIDSYYLASGIRGMLIDLGARFQQFYFQDWVVCLFCAFIFVMFIVAHFLMYRIKAWKYELDLPLFNPIIGTDIDGVIGDQLNQFIKYFNVLNEKQISEADITTLPVHRAGKISRVEEEKVFHTREYWETMPFMIDCIQELGDLRDKLGYKIEYFTSRPWAITGFDLEKETLNWLQKSKLPMSKKVLFERGNSHLPVRFADAWNRNRIRIAQKSKIKYFIEDDLDKALLLSNTCKAVFLFDYAYNRTIVPLPFNVFRVTSWKQVFDLIKKFG